MRKNDAAEAIYTKYAEPKAPKADPYAATRSIKKRRGTTLSDFYQEVYAADSQKMQHPYQNKNAKEIELFMMNNRKLIENNSGYKR